MKKEIEFIKSATEKLRTQGDITVDEANYIFILATVIYTYELGQHFGKQYLNNFNSKFNYPDVSRALSEWYDEVCSQISDKFEFHNFVATIPSMPLCPVFTGVRKEYAPTLHAIYKTWYEKGRVLECNWKTTNNFYNANKDTNKEMLRWLLKNVLLSFDVIYGKLNEIYFTRYGVLGLLPVYEREIEQEKLHKLSEYNVPFLQSANSRRALSHKYYSIVCPIEYKDVVNAIADDQPIPKVMPVETKTRIPKDVAYIEYLTSRLYNRGDIELEEADNLYLLFKTYQMLRAMANKVTAPLTAIFRQKVRSMAEPGLQALRLWYEAVEKMLKQNKHGNFVQTLPNNTSMNLYQLGAPIKRCLKILPKEPPEVIVRCNDVFDIKDVCLDVGRVAIKTEFDEYAYYISSRYGFFERNGIDMSLWKTITKYENRAWKDIFESPRKHMMENIMLGKLCFAEYLGIKYIIINNAIAVQEEDRKKALEILNLPNNKILYAAELAVQKDLEKIQNELTKRPEDETLVNKERALRTMNADNIALEYITQGVKMVYKAQKDKEEYIEDGDWMEVVR